MLINTLQDLYLLESIDLLYLFNIFLKYTLSITFLRTYIVIKKDIKSK